jgi:hypothetical protein
MMELSINHLLTCERRDASYHLAFDAEGIESGQVGFGGDATSDGDLRAPAERRLLHFLCSGLAHTLTCEQNERAQADYHQARKRTSMSSWMAGMSIPARRPSRSTNVTRNPPAYSTRSRMQSLTSEET